MSCFLKSFINGLCMSPRVLMILRLIDGVQRCPELVFHSSCPGVVLDMSRVQRRSPAVCGPGSVSYTHLHSARHYFKYHGSGSQLCNILIYYNFIQTI